MVQCVANVNELLHIDAASLKNEVDIGTPAIDAPRKFGHTQTAIIENGFDELPYVNILLRGHIAYHFPMTIKKRGSYNLLTPRFSTTHILNKFFHAILQWRTGNLFLRMCLTTIVEFWVSRIASNRY